jgi:predicted anti-sigma-YlaC factor YlaD
MINQRIIELINQELDGTTSATKSARLYRHLEKSPEAQAYFDGQKKLHGILDRAKQVEPPASLKTGILNAVRASVKPERAKLSILEVIVTRLSSPAVPRYGFAVASGICIGMLIFAVLTGGIESATQPEQIAGTMGAVASPAGTVADYGILEGVSTTSSVQVVTAGLQVFVEAEVEGSDSYEITLIFPSEEYAVVGIRRHAGVLTSVRSETGSVSATIGHSGRFIVELDRIGPGGPPVRIELRQSGTLVWEKALKTIPSE